MIDDKRLPLVAGVNLEYETKPNGLKYPKLSNSGGRTEMSPMARRALDMLNEMNRYVLDYVNMSGLNETIFEEIADKVTEIKMKRLDEMKQSTTFSSDYMTKAAQMTEIDMTADREATELMQQYLNKMITDTQPMSFREMRNYHIS